MTASILKQMGIQQWRLRQSEPVVPAVESPDVQLSENREFNETHEPQEAFDPNQMWSNEPQAHDDFSAADAVAEKAAPTSKPLSESMGFAANTDRTSKADANRIAKPSVDSSVDSSKGDSPKPMPSPMPKLMPAPAPMADHELAAIAEKAPAAALHEEPAAKTRSNAHDPVAHLDWQGLQALIDQQSYCQTCSPKSSILGSGDANANWMFVSDAPSQDDLSLQQLFSGRAGHLYEAMLHAVGLDLSLIHI